MVACRGARLAAPNNQILNEQEQHWKVVCRLNALIMGYSLRRVSCSIEGLLFKGREACLSGQCMVQRRCMGSICFKWQRYQLDWMD